MQEATTTADRLLLPLYAEFDVDVGAWVLKNDAEEVLAWVEDEQTARDLAQLGDLERNAFAELAAVYDRLDRQLRPEEGEPEAAVQLKRALRETVAHIEPWAVSLHRRAHRQQEQTSAAIQQLRDALERRECALTLERQRRERLQDLVYELESIVAELKEGRAA